MFGKTAVASYLRNASVFSINIINNFSVVVTRDGPDDGIPNSHGNPTKMEIRLQFGNGNGQDHRWQWE